MCKRLRILFFVTVGLFYFFSAQAQHKTHLPWQIWPEVQAEYVFKTRHFLYFRNQYRYDPGKSSRYLGSEFPGNHVERIQFRLGYEHLLSNKWSMGGSEMYGIEANRYLLFTDVYVRHVNTMDGGVQITQRLMADYLWYSDVSRRVGRLRPRLDIDKVFRFSHWIVRPRIGYELFLSTYFHNQLPIAGKLINRTRLRFETGWQPGPHFIFTPYYTKQIDYIKIPDRIDNQTNLLIRGDNHHRVIAPIWGVELRYVFFQGKVPFSRLPAAVQQD